MRSICPVKFEYTIPGLVINLDARDPAGNGILPADASALGTWQDLSENDYFRFQANSGNKPTFYRNSINNRPAVSFNGSSSYMIGLPINDTSTTSWTVFIGYKLADIASDQILYLNGTETGTIGGHSYEITPGVPTAQRTVTFPGVVFKYDGYATTDAEIATIQWNGTTTILRINGVDQTINNATDAPNNFSSGSGFLGTSNFASPPYNPLNGSIFKFMEYHNPLTTDQMLSIERYIGNIWGVPVP